MCISRRYSLLLFSKTIASQESKLFRESFHLFEKVFPARNNRFLARFKHISRQKLFHRRNFFHWIRLGRNFQVVRRVCFEAILNLNFSIDRFVSFAATTRTKGVSLSRLIRKFAEMSLDMENVINRWCFFSLNELENKRWIFSF